MDMETSIDTIGEITSANISELLSSYLETQEHALEDTMMRPYIEITEQPKPKVRFRYECEGRSAGSIMGALSTSDTKSYPSIKIRDYQGEAHVVVSCVTLDEPYRPHPHKLVGKDNCRDGIFFTHFSAENNEDMRYTFTNLGIQCMKKKDIRKSLEVRESQGVDPFETGYSHRENTSSINLNAVRLCFQVFLPISGTNNVRKLKPIVSEPIFDTKSNSDLIIHTLSHVSAPVAGGMKMILLCDKVNKDDVKIRFFEEEDEAVVWESYGDFCDKDVHKQVAIVFKTPPYKSFDTAEPVNVKIQLVNSKGSLSDPYNFKLTPLDSEEDMKRKRHKSGSEYFRGLKINVDCELDKKRKRGASGVTGPPSVKMEVPDPTLYQWPNSGHVSPYPHSRTPSPSYAGQSYQPIPNVYSPSSSQAVFVSPQNPFSTPTSSRGAGPQSSPDPCLLYPISQPNNPVFVPLQQTHTPEAQGAHSTAGAGAGGASFPNILVTNMDTQETTYQPRPGDSLNEVDSADLLDPGTLSQNLTESLNISETNPNNSDSLTHIANDAYNNLT